MILSKTFNKCTWDRVEEIGKPRDYRQNITF